MLHLLDARLEPRVGDVQRDGDGSRRVRRIQAVPGREHRGDHRNEIRQHVVEVIQRDGRDARVRGGQC